MFNNTLYNTPYHSLDISKYKFLVTGGAGFIGSNLVEYLLRYGAGHVRVLDNLSNGYYQNIQDFIGLPNFEFIQGDICNFETCKEALENIDFVLHQAALGSVPRSISDPIASNNVNINGFLNILVAAKESKTLKRLVYAASSSTYGDSPLLPKVEGKEGKPLSPYAVTKLVNELYAEVFSKVYGLHTIGLRYFNVFGPKQNPSNPYAAVIPKFIDSALNNIQPKINGDGTTYRDFTFVENVVQANILSILSEFILEQHEVVNVACGRKTSLNEIWEMISSLAKCKDLNPIYCDERSGDIKYSLADISKAARIFNYNPIYSVEDGLSITSSYIQNQKEITK